ncbi:MAG TPA: T9SS type A sorting domain-containing protein [Candidatus Kryptobacter bacterium]|nr:T9SS type A sorting domain-containing protein [Candidatus Kryptobacter bacterium]
MKPLFSVLFACTILLAFESVFAQTGSDYYLPLRVGNYVKFHTTGLPSGWTPRTTTYAIEGADSISGHVYFREKDTEVADNGNFNDAFNVIWLTNDATGNVLIAAVSDSSSKLDSAIILEAPSPYFSSQSLAPGYSIRYPFNGLFMVDSTISDSETVDVPAGTFTNCVKKSETHYDSLGKVVFLEYHYYAFGVGMVLNERVMPDNDAHTDVLVEYSTATSVRGTNATATSGSFSLSQNYPNPFNPSTVISYQLSAVSNVSLKIYDVLGRELKTLINERQTAGNHSVNFNAGGLPSGVYFYRLQAGTSTDVRKMLLMK